MQQKITRDSDGILRRKDGRELTARSKAPALLAALAEFTAASPDGWTRVSDPELAERAGIKVTELHNGRKRYGTIQQNLRALEAAGIIVRTFDVLTGARKLRIQPTPARSQYA